MAKDRHIGVVGLGYVGLPVATSFGMAGWPVIGFDIDISRLAELNAAHDRTGEVEPESLRGCRVQFTADPAVLGNADFFIVTVPTPIDEANNPDLRALRAASRTVGTAMKRGAIVVYESTVYPGATEEECLPILEDASGLKSGVDFTVGYSPERINPGDKSHRFETILKVVAAQTRESTDIVADVYGSVVTAGVFKAASIKVAEAAKVIENTQRDLNIAFVNELAKIFRALDLDTGDVLAAAGTKWNFLPFRPGLVGGHCIGVDPFYLTHRAQRAGYHPEVILAGRRINDTMGSYIAHECIRLMMNSGSKGRRVTVLGVTFKENVPDVRNSKIVNIVWELQRFNLDVQVADPIADVEEVEREFGIRLCPFDELRPADAVIFGVAHRAFADGGWDLVSAKLEERSGVVLDVKGVLDRNTTPPDIELWRL